MQAPLIFPPFFTEKDFLFSATALRNGIKNTWRTRQHRQNALELIHYFLIPIRDEIGRMRETSGYRVPELNKLIGGSPTSDHETGCALDFIPLELNIIPAFNEIIQVTKTLNLEFNQIILEERGLTKWIHVSRRPTGNKKQILHSPKAGVYQPYTLA